MYVRENGTVYRCQPDPMGGERCGNCMEWLLWADDHHCRYCGAVVVVVMEAGSSDNGGPHDQLRSLYLTSEEWSVHCYGGTVPDLLNGYRVVINPDTNQAVAVRSGYWYNFRGTTRLRQLYPTLLGGSVTAGNDSFCEDCPECGGKVRSLKGNDMFCLDCDWDNLSVIDDLPKPKLLGKGFEVWRRLLSDAMDLEENRRRDE